MSLNIPPLPLQLSTPPFTYSLSLFLVIYNFKHPGVHAYESSSLHIVIIILQLKGTMRSFPISSRLISHCFVHFQLYGEWSVLTAGDCAGIHGDCALLASIHRCNGLQPCGLSHFIGDFYGDLILFVPPDHHFVWLFSTGLSIFLFCLCFFMNAECMNYLVWKLRIWLAFHLNCLIFVPSDSF